MSIPQDDARYRELDALPTGAQALPTLLAALRDESWRVRRLAAERLAALEPTPDLIAALVRLLAQRDETGARNAAAGVLAQLGLAAVPAVSALLGHADPDQRKFAADILGELQRGEATDALLVALRDPDANVRVAAAEALGRVGGPLARRALEGLLTSAEVMLRVCALNGLAALASPPSLPALLPLLHDPLTRRSAWRLLAHVDHPTVALLTVRALATAQTRDAALGALGAARQSLSNEFEGELRVALRPVPGVRAWLEAALESSEDERHFGAVRVARALGDAALAPALVSSVRGERDGELVLDAVVRLGTPAARALLASPELLANLPGEARAVAADAIVRLSEPGLVPQLVTLIDSGDPELAELGARALGRTRSRYAIAALLRLFEDDALAVHAYRSLVALAASWPQEVRDALAPMMAGELRPHEVRAWAEITGEDAVGVIRRALHADDDALRAAAVEASLHVPSETLQTLRAALMDEVTMVRRAAARAVGQLDAAAAEGLLQHALTDGEASVLALACVAAGASGSTASAPRLVELTRHADAAVVVAALESLALLGRLADEVLLRAATHPSPEVVKLAYALGADRPGVLAQAPAALSHPRWDVRVAAARALAVSGPRGALGELLDAVAREPDAVARGLLSDAADALARRV